MTDWIKTLAPLLGTALGGPLGGAAAAFIAGKIGIESKTIEAVSDVLNSGKLSPDQLAGIKLAEIDFQKFLEANKIDLAKIDAANTQGARDMQVAVRSRIPGTLALVIVSGFFTILILMMLGILQVSDQQSLLLLLGALSAGFGSVLNYYYGSTLGSSEKTKLMMSK